MICAAAAHSQFRLRHLRLPQLVGYGEMQMIGSGRRFGRDVDVLVESGVLHSDVLSFGKRLFDAELAALFLMDFDVDTLYPVLGCNLALQVKVASGNGGLTCSLRPLRSRRQPVFLRFYLLHCHRRRRR